MLGNFAYCNPTKLYFGEDSLQYLNTELPKYGENVVLVYGGGSIKKNGIYDEVLELLKKNGKKVAEISGVMPNPTLEKLYEGIEIARNHHADLLLEQFRIPVPQISNNIFPTDLRHNERIQILLWNNHRQNLRQLPATGCREGRTLN